VKERGRTFFLLTPGLPCSSFLERARVRRRLALGVRGGGDGLCVPADPVSGTWGQKRPRKESRNCMTLLLLGEV